VRTAIRVARIGLPCHRAASRLVGGIHSTLMWAYKEWQTPTQRREKGPPMDTDTRTSPPTTRSRRDVGTFEPPTAGAPGILRPSTPSAPRTAGGSTAATAMAPLFGVLFTEGIPVRFEFWDGSSLGPDDGAGTVHVRSADAINRLMWAPGELGLARAYVTGDLELEGDIYQALRALHAAAPADLNPL
jgi:hypothetical protein